MVKTWKLVIARTIHKLVSFRLVCIFSRSIKIYFLFHCSWFCFRCVRNHIFLERCLEVPTSGMRAGFLSSRFEILRFHKLIKKLFFIDLIFVHESIKYYFFNLKKMFFMHERSN